MRGAARERSTSIPDLEYKPTHAKGSRNYFPLGTSAFAVIVEVKLRICVRFGDYSGLYNIADARPSLQLAEFQKARSPQTGTSVAVSITLKESAVSF